VDKAHIITPLYISVAWILITTYQFFTQTTVTTVTAQIQTFSPILGSWLTTRLDLVTFIHSFAWIFLLSSAIPSIILGKTRGILAQFSVCLVLTFIASIIQDVLTGLSIGTLDKIFGLAPLFQNPILAGAYLSLPYILMIGFDIRGRRQYQKMTLGLKPPKSISKDAFTEKDNFEEEEKTQEEEQVYAT
jgi:hypothetical protein